MAQPAAQSFGKYQILERIATGAMAEIYKARLEGIGGFQRTFAIKRILPHLSRDEDYVRLLVDEAKVAGLLSHANIVQILDLGQVDGIWYIAMEYVWGRDLGAVIRRAADKGIVLPVPHAVFIAIELLKGLEYAHLRQVMRAGRAVPLHIVHRDVSPPNILLSFQGEVKLTDFGIARASSKVQESLSGLVTGRFDYMSPEQAEGRRDVDQRADLFSVGVVLYEMLTGVHPFRRDGERATVEAIRAGEFEPIAGLNQDVPPALERVVAKALAVDPDDRHASATAFKEALDQFFHDAGFIFTHSTLAAYVRGLFPTEVQREVEPTPSPTPPADATLDDLELDDYGDDGPTRVMDRERVGDAEKPTAADPKPVSSKVLDESTVVRPSPLMESDGALDAGPWGDEQETVVQASPFARPPVDATVAQHDERPFPSFTPPPARPGPGAGAVAGIGVLGLAAALLMFALGLFVGVAGAVSVIELSAGNVLATAAPRLHVAGPPDAVVRVDGVEIPGEAILTASTAHRVEVEIDGRVRWAATVTLQPGELRTLVVDMPKVGSQ